MNRQLTVNACGLLFKILQALAAIVCASLSRLMIIVLSTNPLCPSNLNTKLINFNQLYLLHTSSKLACMECTEEPL